MRLVILLREPNQSYVHWVIHLPMSQLQNLGGDTEEGRQAG
jgi:hypothetical protein